MSDEAKPEERCIGFGPNEGTCRNRAGTAWTDFWCPECDRARRERITHQLREPAEGFESGRDQP